MASSRRPLADLAREHAQRVTDIYNAAIDRLEEHRRDLNEQGANLPPLQRPEPLPPAAPKKRRRRP